MGLRFHWGLPRLGLLAIAGLFLLLLATAAGCGSDSTVTVYSGRGETLVDPIIQRFKAVTGIDVQVKYAGTPQLAATLLEEGDRTPADVFFAQDPGGLGAVESLLTPLPSSILDQVPQWARSNEGLWVGLSGRARTVVYNTDRVSEDDLPDDIFDFVHPRWEDRIGWAPTNASFQTMVTAMRVTWGEDKTRQWLEGIKDNEPRVFSSNTPIVDAVGAGEIDVGFVNHYYLHRFLAEEGQSFPARNYHTRAGGPGALIMVAGAGMLATSNHQEEARLFLEFLLSTEGQSYFASETFEYPLASAVGTSPALVPLDRIDHPDIPLRDLADINGTQALLRSVGVIP